MKEIYLYNKKAKNKNVINVGLSYPSTYFYGMSVLGFLNMFKEFDRNSYVNAQRIFLDTNSLAFNPKYLDILGFSLIFETDIFQAFKIMKNYKFNILAEKRRRIKPLIFAGGPLVTSNPEPFCDFFDFFNLGDGENIAEEITSVYMSNKNKTKAEILNALSDIEGIYVPTLKNSVGKKVYSLTKENLVKKRTFTVDNALYSPIISDKTFYSDTVFIEIVRGCPNLCKFCSAHYQNRPFRYPSLKSIKKALKQAAKFAKKIVLIGSLISRHPDFDEIIHYISILQTKFDFEVEISAIEFGYLNKNLLDIVSVKELSFSLECGSEQMREKIGKELSDETIFKTFDFYNEQNLSKVMLYTMIGLPEENIQDIQEYIDFSIKIAKKYPEIKFLHVISTFVPKPFTPFERKKRATNIYLKEAFDIIAKNFKENNIDYKFSNIALDNFSTLLSVSGKDFGKFLYFADENKIQPTGLFKAYHKFAKEHKEFNLEHFSKLCFSNKNETEPMPYDFIKQSRL